MKLKLNLWLYNNHKLILCIKFRMSSSIINFHNVKLFYIFKQLRIRFNQIASEIILWHGIKKETDDGFQIVEYWTKNYKKQGPCKWLYKLEKYVKEESFYVNDKLNGSTKGWYSNGQIWVEGHFVNGKIEGLYKSWYRNGVIEEESFWEKGIKISCKLYDANGDVVL